MKKLFALILTVIMILTALTSCFGETNPIEKDPATNERVKIRIGYMAGPTGMGMAKLIHDNGGINGNENYVFTKYADTNAAKLDLAAGKIDVICLPTNEAAVYFNKNDNTSTVLAINCLNSLYLISKNSTEITSLAQLEGSTVYTCKNGTPRTVLEYLISVLGLNITVSYEIDGKEILTPADLSAQVIAGNLPNAVMPEPLVTSSILKINSTTENNADKWSVKLDLADFWSEISTTPITMGCILARGKFAEENANSINQFLEEYQASIEYIGNPDNLDSAAEYVVETEVMAAVPAAKTALKNLGDSIFYIDGQNMKTALTAFYMSIGVEVPKDNFFYEK